MFHIIMVIYNWPIMFFFFSNTLPDVNLEKYAISQTAFTYYYCLYVGIQLCHWKMWHI